MFNVPLPFVGGNDIAHSQEFEVVEFHCKDSNTKAIGMATVGTGVGKYFGREGRCVCVRGRGGSFPIQLSSVAIVA